VISPHRVRRSGIRARQISGLDPRDRTKHLEIPCTSVARTLLDLAATGRDGELRAALEQAEVLGLFDLVAISDVMRRNEGSRGIRLLRSSLVAMTADGPKLRSRFERRFLPISRSVGLGEPLTKSRHSAFRRADRGRLPLARPSPGRGVRRLPFPQGPAGVPRRPPA
jgi:hypothetical protein